jgi:hypothetical protein
MFNDAPDARAGNGYAQLGDEIEVRTDGVLLPIACHGCNQTLDVLVKWPEVGMMARKQAVRGRGMVTSVTTDGGCLLRFPCRTCVANNRQANWSPQAIKQESMVIYQISPQQIRKWIADYKAGQSGKYVADGVQVRR